MLHVCHLYIPVLYVKITMLNVINPKYTTCAHGCILSVYILENSACIVIIM